MYPLQYKLEKFMFKFYYIIEDGLNLFSNTITKNYSCLLLWLVGSPFSHHSYFGPGLRTLRPFWGTKTSKVQLQLSFEGTTKTNKKKLLWNHHTIKFDTGGVQKYLKKNFFYIYIQKQTFLRHYLNSLWKMATKVNIQSCTPPILNLLLCWLQNSFFFFWLYLQN